MSGANYNGRVGNNTTNTRYFTEGQQPSLWIPATYSNNTVLTPSSKNYQNVYIPGNLYVDGSIINPSDLTLKDNIVEISSDLSDAILKLKPTQFTFKTDSSKQIHYGFIAQEFEEHYPELVTLKPNPNTKQYINSAINTQNIKAINYLEILPLLVHKVQSMQQEIDELKALIKDKL